MRDHDEDFEGLLDRSSLGTPAARRLRSRKSSGRIRATQQESDRHHLDDQPLPEGGSVASASRRHPQARTRAGASPAGDGQTRPGLLPGGPCILDPAPADDPHSAGVWASYDLGRNTVELVVAGRWGSRLAREVRSGLGKCLTQHPAAIIVDLCALADPDAVSTSLWLTAPRQGAAMSPAVSLMFCVPAEGRLARRLRRMGRLLAVFGTVDEARAAVAGGGTADRLSVHLDPDEAAIGRARRLVAEACRTWAVPSLAGTAALVTSELVANAVEHAGTDIVVVVSRRGRAVHVAVRDRDTTMPLFQPASAAGFSTTGSSRGVGLRIVNSAAAAWGALPTIDGKVVWASLRADRP